MYLYTDTRSIRLPLIKTGTIGDLIFLILITISLVLLTLVSKWFSSHHWI